MQAAVLAAPLAVACASTLVYTGVAAARSLEVTAAFTPSALECTGMIVWPLVNLVVGAILWRLAVSVAAAECARSGRERACQSQVNAIATAALLTIASAAHAILALVPCASFAATCTTTGLVALLVGAFAVALVAYGLFKACAYRGNVFASTVIIVFVYVVLAFSPCISASVLWRDALTTIAATGIIVALWYLASTLPTRALPRKEHTN
jgi:hypothetical protein